MISWYGLIDIQAFALNIATLALGNVGGGAGAAASVGNAIEVIREIGNLVNEVGIFLTAITAERLAESVQALLELYPVVEKMVDAVERFETDPTVEIPSMDNISGTGKGDANAAAIVTMAAWDRWILESDQQIEFAVNENVNGATDYRLALRKHAINGKQLAQAQAGAIKAGYEYAQAQMDVILAQQQIDGLENLKNEFKGQEAIHAEAESMFYDRAMALRTSVVLSLRNMAWAYRYWALADSSIVLDAGKPLVEYQQDLTIIIIEMEHADSQYASGFQRKYK